MSETLPAMPELEFDPKEIAGRTAMLSPEEGAVVLEFLPVEIAAEVAHRLGSKLAGLMLARMDSRKSAEVIAAMQQAEGSRVLEEMAPDDRVDCLEQMDRPLHDALVQNMDAPHAAETRRLEQYPPDTAGGIMTPLVTALPRQFTVEQAVAELRRLVAQLGTMFYVYVVDEERRLVGVLSMRDLILAAPDSTLEKIMIPRVKSVPATMDQEEVARLMRRSRYLALPVVDKDERLVGMVTFDDVVDVIQEEATEDVQRMFGAGAEERLTSPWHFSFSKRIWWLQVNLGTAFLAGAVVAVFGATIQQFAVLAIYMPVVSGMGSNASAQAMSVAIRGISTGRTDRKLLRHVLTREAIVGLLTGIIVGITTALIAVVWQYHSGLALGLGLIVAMALLITQTTACVSGAALPFLMKRMGFDPAQSATIFATTITDITAFATLLGFAQLCHGWLLR